jgi:hypothetical protein
MTSDDLQNAIDLAAKGGLARAVGTAFGFNLKAQRYQPKPGCLKKGYSSGEAVVCGILLCFYFEIHGTPDNIDMPDRAEWERSVVDVVWLGAYYFVRAAHLLTERDSWSAIRMILPGNEKMREV